jgi:hypothetical protein
MCGRQRNEDSGRNIVFVGVCMLWGVRRAIYDRWGRKKGKAQG